MSITQSVAAYTETLSREIGSIEVLTRYQYQLHELFMEHRWEELELHIMELQRIGEGFTQIEEHRHANYLVLRRALGLPDEGKGIADFAEKLDAGDWEQIQKLHRDIKICVSRYRMLSNCFYEFVGERREYQEKFLAACVPGYEDKRYGYQGNYSPQDNNFRALLCDRST